MPRLRKRGDLSPYPHVSSYRGDKHREGTEGEFHRKDLGLNLGGGIVYPDKFYLLFLSSCRLYPNLEIGHYYFSIPFYLSLQIILLPCSRWCSVIKIRKTNQSDMGDFVTSKNSSTTARDS
jgi:hypothetical protein